MGFETFKNNNLVVKILKKEIQLEKNSGTYLFYGAPIYDLEKIAISYAKALNCLNEYEKDDFCDICINCKEIKIFIFPDIHVITNDTSIEKVREVLSKGTQSSFNNNKKIIILKNVSKFRIDVLNTLLKYIEEPTKGTFYLLLSKNLNILKTIISRSMLLKIVPNLPQTDLEKKIYEFFNGEIEKDSYSNENLSLISENKTSYNDLDIHLEEYIKYETIIEKINIITGVIDYKNKKKLISHFDKIKFIENISHSIKKDKKLIKWLLNTFILKDRNNKNLAKLINIKNNIEFNINVELSLYVFFDLY